MPVKNKHTAKPDLSKATHAKAKAKSAKAVKAAPKAKEHSPVVESKQYVITRGSRKLFILRGKLYSVTI